MAYLYRHIRLDKQEVFYIGIGSDENYSRANNKISRTKHWKNIAKGGYEVEIMLDDLTWEEACEKEVEFIKLYGRKDLKEGTLVNKTFGGEGTLGYKHSEETKEKCRQAAKGNNNFFFNKKRPDHSKKMSGKHNPCYGKFGKDHPAYGNTCDWLKTNPPRNTKVEYKGIEYKSKTKLALSIGVSNGLITKWVKKGLVKEIK